MFAHVGLYRKLLRGACSGERACLSRTVCLHQANRLASRNGRASMGIRRSFRSMTIHLSKDLEQIVHNAVLTGLYAREDDVIRDALTRLQQTMPKPARVSAQKAKSGKAVPQKPKKKPLTEAEFDQHLLAIGLMSQLPDTDADFDDPDDEPVAIKGEPLSETVIRERR